MQSKRSIKLYETSFTKLNWHVIFFSLNNIANKHEKLYGCMYKKCIEYTKDRIYWNDIDKFWTISQEQDENCGGSCRKWKSRSLSLVKFLRNKIMWLSKLSLKGKKIWSHDFSYGNFWQLFQFAWSNKR